MAQIFDRNSNALARASLVLTGLIVTSKAGKDAGWMWHYPFTLS
jgi:hypothetical protein